MRGVEQITPGNLIVLGIGIVVIFVVQRILFKNKRR
jgi:hypothetical protein